MCVAVPGKITAINGNVGEVDFNGNTVTVKLDLIDAKEGDYVLVHAGCAMEVMGKTRAEELISLFEELEDVLRENE